MELMTSRLQPPVVGAERPADLPDFERPPVVEVVLGVQFTELTAYRTWHAGLLWDSTFRAHFPRCVEQPPLDPLFETFGSQKPARNLLRIQQMSGPIVPRLWFVSHDESDLIQFQSDRFLHNWRRFQQDTRYPRYEPVRERFFEEISDVMSFLNNNEIGLLEPNQCEITYVNHIKLNDGGDPRLDFWRIFTFFGPFQSNTNPDSAHETQLEDGRFAIRFVIFERHNKQPLGRLHIVAEPAVETDDTPIVRLSLTARGSPISPTLQGVADFLDVGRESIVRTFAAITTEEMHKIWGRIR
jgi:uncharacterized protein (TIGR04255 family)